MKCKQVIFGNADHLITISYIKTHVYHSVTTTSNVVYRTSREKCCIVVLIFALVTIISSDMQCKHWILRKYFLLIDVYITLSNDRHSLFFFSQTSSFTNNKNLLFIYIHSFKVVALRVQV